ncbi:coiled-coil domain-containing protein 83 isoform X2 [Sardina pilchardus]|uniref:coiled-coil domain-containing protein 83 isoform X2 n=1 Tax=Sardina pilchardus TaxID=27697 RepID=UPI002E0FA7D6
MGKKTSDEDASLAESFIDFQIQVKRKEIEEFKEDVAQLESEKQKLLELRDQLREEQKGHITVLRKQAKEQERKLEQRGEVNKEQVEDALHQNLELSRNKEKELAELNQGLKCLVEQVVALQAEREIWLQYKHVGRHKDKERTDHLKEELAGLQKNFEEMAENINRSLEVTFNEIDKKKVQLMDDKKQLASERAIKLLDKNTRQEIKENGWLKKEVAVYKMEVSIMEEAVQKLEEENLKLTSDLFTQRLEDLQISRNVFLTQAAGLGPSDSFTLEDTFMKKDSTVQVRGHMAVVQAAVDGVVTQAEIGDRGCSGGSPAAVSEEGWPQDLRPLLYGGQIHLKETMHLGSLEQKLLSVVGQTMPLHTASPDTHCSGGDDWPVTVHIIRNRFQ